MIQYGDIRALSGYTLEPVDLIVGGSPCQNLSIAGNRKGLEGSESGLFLEMIRIIREMREQTNGVYPRYALWENVPGAFSSNKGKDFSAVLGEFARIIEPTAPDVPVPQEGWSKSGIIFLSDGTVAWRTHDAQYWGVPQRRRRISLVADFRGQSAPEILFERKGMYGDPEQSEAQREGSTETTARSVGDTSRVEEWITAVNASAKHQQDLLQSDLGVARTLAPGTHAAGSHLTKTLITKLKGSEGSAGSVEDRSGETGDRNALIVLNDQGGGQMDVTDGTAMTLRSQSHGHEPVILEERERERESPVISFQERSGKPGGEKGSSSRRIM